MGAYFGRLYPPRIGTHEWDASHFVGIGCQSVAMTLDDRAVAWLLGSQRGVLSRPQAFASGVSVHGLRHRARPGGPWQRILPGIYLTFTGQATHDQRAMAAILYAGPDSVITGPAALRSYKIRNRETPIVDVLVPASRKRANCSYVVVHRTRRMPLGGTSDLALMFAPAERAVADTVRGLDKLSDARAVVASAVQQRCCSLQQLVTELTDGPIRGSARLRAVLAEVLEGIRSVAEAEFADLIRSSGLPLPLFNHVLYLNGKWLAIPDAWWPEAGVVVEIESREWHLSPEDWEETLRRDRRMGAAGIVVMHVSPRQVRDEPERILRDIAAALRPGRPVPGITTLPSEA
jgi:hypothetical protein